MRPATTPDAWVRAPELWWRTRRARKSGDFGSVLRAAAGNADTAIGIRLRGRYVLLLLDPALVGELLVEHAAVSTKGPGARLTRQVLGDGLLTTEGEPHDRARRLIAPAFSPRRLTGYTEAFGERTRARVAGWQDGQTVDAHDAMAALTLDIVGATLLGIDLSGRMSTIRDSLESAFDRFGKAGGGALLGRPGRSRPPAGEAPETALHAIVEQVIAQRRANPTADRGDVVSALLADGAVRDGLSAQEIHDHVITLMMAGHETTANALTWTLFLLGKHPTVQDRLRAEALPYKASGPQFKDLPALPYARAVLSEAMRLYPPAWLMGRTIRQPLEFAGWHAPAGTLVGVSQLLLHRDPRWFPEPAVFDPNRWLDDRRRKVPKYAYLPFGTGPRACIGEQFAWAEATAALAVVVANWRLHTDRDLTPEIQYRITLRPSGAVPITVRRV